MTSPNPNLPALRRGLTPIQLAFIEAYDGDTYRTAERLGLDRAQAVAWAKTEWFLEKLERRNEREVERVKSERVRVFRAQVLDRIDLQAFWSEVVTSEEAQMRDRLAASKHLADSIGMFTQKIELSGDESKPIAVRQVDLEDRIKQLATAGAPAHAMDFLE